MSHVEDVSDIPDEHADKTGTELTGAGDDSPDRPSEGKADVETSSGSGSAIRVERETITEQERKRLLERTRGVR